MRPPCLALPPASNASPSISGLFSKLGGRGNSAVPEILPQLDASERQDIALPVSGSMSLMQIDAREAKGNEVNEVTIENHRRNPVEKYSAL